MLPYLASFILMSLASIGEAMLLVPAFCQHNKVAGGRTGAVVEAPVDVQRTQAIGRVIPAPKRLARHADQARILEAMQPQQQL
jgi:hypothetical protein